MSLFSNKKEEIKKEEPKVEVKATPVAETKPVKETKTVKETKPAAKVEKPVVKEEKPVVATPKTFTDEKVYDETGFIAKGTKIDGNITTNGHLIVDGNITGATNVKGDLVIHGNAGGNVQCENLFITGSSLKTTINVDNNVIVDEETTFAGKITCKNITVYGKIDGDIVAKEAVILKKTATVKGTITTARIGVEPGAVVNGNVKIK